MQTTKNTLAVAVSAMLAIVSCIAFGQVAAGRSATVAATGHIYWLQYNGPSSSELGRANLNGSHANLNFMRIGKSSAIALHHAHLYWLSSHGVGRANLDGTGRKPSFVRTPSFGDITPGGLAVDSSHIYFTNPAAEPSDNTIARANINGTGLNAKFINLAGWARNGGPTYLALTSHYIYWLTGDGIGRANLDGTGVVDPYIRIPGLLFALGFAFDGSHFYWTLGGSIGRVNADGGGLNKHFITRRNHPAHIEVFDGHIYWGEGYLTGVLRRANIDGTHIVTVLTHSGTVNGLAFAPH